MCLRWIWTCCKVHVCMHWRWKQEDSCKPCTTVGQDVQTCWMTGKMAHCMFLTHWEAAEATCEEKDDDWSSSVSPTWRLTIDIIRKHQCPAIMWNKVWCTLHWLEKHRWCTDCRSNFKCVWNWTKHTGLKHEKSCRWPTSQQKHAKSDFLGGISSSAIGYAHIKPKHKSSISSQCKRHIVVAWQNTEDGPSVRDQRSSYCPSNVLRFDFDIHTISWCPVPSKHDSRWNWTSNSWDISCGRSDILYSDLRTKLIEAFQWLTITTLLSRYKWTHRLHWGLGSTQASLLTYTVSIETYICATS